jgi:hypothetical protein
VGVVHVNNLSEQQDRNLGPIPSARKHARLDSHSGHLWQKFRKTSQPKTSKANRTKVSKPAKIKLKDKRTTKKQANGNKQEVKLDQEIPIPERSRNRM